jgi:hypothetical protein
VGNGNLKGVIAETKADGERKPERAIGQACGRGKSTLSPKVKLGRVA